MVRYEEQKNNNCDHSYRSLSHMALCKTSTHGELRGDWPCSNISGPCRTFEPFSNEGPLLTALPLMSSLFIRSIPRGQFKCHGLDCKMRSVLGSLSSPQESSVITLAQEMRVDSEWTHRLQPEIVNFQQMRSWEAAKILTHLWHRTQLIGGHNVKKRYIYISFFHCVSCSKIKVSNLNA